MGFRRCDRQTDIKMRALLLTLLTFCIGSFAGSLTRHLWKLPSLPPISLGKTLGWMPAVILQLSVFLLIAIALWQWNRTNGKQPITADSLLKNPQSNIKNRWLPVVTQSCSRFKWRFHDGLRSPASFWLQCRRFF